MVQPDLVSISVTAFSAVFVLLAVLAGVMQLITSLYPQKGAPVAVQTEAEALAAPIPSTQLDTAQIAAITTTYQRVFPGKRVTRIEEKT